jgi:holo-[acyl-carrier protein] synthase
MNHAVEIAAQLADRHGSRVRVGIDIVDIERVRESLQAFGDRFERRLFTPQEISYASQIPSLAPQRYAARFAAKEAALKALRLTEAGIDWRQLEVVRTHNGECTLRLHGKAAALAVDATPADLSLSLSHDGGYAVACVMVMPSDTNS